MASGLVWQPATRRCFPSNKATRTIQQLTTRHDPPVLIDRDMQKFEIPSRERTTIVYHRKPSSSGQVGTLCWMLWLLLLSVRSSFPFLPHTHLHTHIHKQPSRPASQTALQPSQNNRMTIITTRTGMRERQAMSASWRRSPLQGSRSGTTHLPTCPPACPPVKPPPVSSAGGLLVCTLNLSMAAQPRDARTMYMRTIPYTARTVSRLGSGYGLANGCASVPCSKPAKGAAWADEMQRCLV